MTTTEPSATTAPSTNDAALALRPATRFDPAAQTPAAYRALYKLQLAVEDCGLDSALVELLKVRASILNGCACGTPADQPGRQMSTRPRSSVLLPATRSTSCAPPPANPLGTSRSASPSSLSMPTESSRPGTSTRPSV